MNYSKIIGVAVAVACSSVVVANDVVDLQPGDFTTDLSGIMNTQLSELIGVTEFESTQNFSIWGSLGGEIPQMLYQASFLTRIVRSNETGNLHFNYRIITPDSSLSGMVSNVEISGFAGFDTRVEYRDELSAPGNEGPVGADRSISGDVLNFDFGEVLATNEETKFFFAMVNTNTFGFTQNRGEFAGATATVFLHTGEAVTLGVPWPTVPTQGTLGLLSVAGLLTARRRR